MRQITILDVPIDDVLLDEALEQIAAYVRAGGAQHVVTVNPEFIMAAQRDCAFRTALQQADLHVPDGVGINVVARWLRQPLRGRVPGVELCEGIAARSAVEGWRLFLLGAAPGVAEAAARELRRRYGGVQIVGCYAGSPRSSDEAAIRERIRAARPDILFVAYGAPAQDLWIARNQPLLRVPVAIGVGGTLDYLSGNVLRAPHWMRRLGLEWLFRLVRQPWRWKRIWTAVVCFPLAVWRSKERHTGGGQRRSSFDL